MEPKRKEPAEHSGSHRFLPQVSKTCGCLTATDIPSQQPVGCSLDEPPQITITHADHLLPTRPPRQHRPCVFGKACSSGPLVRRGHVSPDPLTSSYARAAAGVKRLFLAAARLFSRPIGIVDSTLESGVHSCHASGRLDESSRHQSQRHIFHWRGSR
jgi:hypothetical protein